MYFYVWTATQNLFNQKHLTYAHSLPWSPSPQVLHQTVYVWQWLSGCSWCKTCVSLPPCTPLVTSGTAGLLPVEVLQELSVATVTLLSSRYRALESGRISFRYFLSNITGQSAFPCSSYIAQFFLSLSSGSWSLWFFCFFIEHHGEIFCSIAVTFKDEWVRFEIPRSHINTPGLRYCILASLLPFVFLRVWPFVI